MILFLFNFLVFGQLLLAARLVLKALLARKSLATNPSMPVAVFFLFNGISIGLFFHPLAFLPMPAANIITLVFRIASLFWYSYAEFHK